MTRARVVRSAARRKTPAGALTVLGATLSAVPGLAHDASGAHPHPHLEGLAASGWWWLSVPVALAVGGLLWRRVRRRIDRPEHDA